MVPGDQVPLYRRNGTGHWWCRIGRKTRKSTGTADRQQAEEFERVLKKRLWRIEKLGDRSAISWSEAAARWLRDSPRTRERDRWFLDWLKPRIGEDAISSVSDPDALEELRADGLAEGWSHSTVDRMMRTVRAVLRACVRWRHLSAYPHVPMYGEVKGKPRFLTEEQFGALCRELPPHLQRAARFAVSTLLRMRSQSHLTWDRIDLKNRIGWVPEDQMKGGEPHGFPLSAQALKVLREIRRADEMKSERVFLYEEEPIDNFFTEAFRKAARRAGLAGLRWHDLRHTGASWAVQRGVTLPQVMELGGWKSYRSVLIYARFAPQHGAAAAQKVGRSVEQALKRRSL